MSGNSSPFLESGVPRRRDQFVSIPVTASLKSHLHQLAEKECSTLAATARRLLARGVERELASLTAEAR